METEKYCNSVIQRASDREADRDGERYILQLSDAEKKAIEREIDMEKEKYCNSVIQKASDREGDRDGEREMLQLSNTESKR